jgi:hypothetical protein
LRNWRSVVVEYLTRLKIGHTTFVVQGEIGKGHRSSSAKGTFIDLTWVIISRSWTKVSIVLKFWFLLSLDFSVLNICTIAGDVSFLVACSQLLLSVITKEDILVSWRIFNIICKFLDGLISKFVEEVNDESAGHFIDLNP